jgi:hypothetical protein
MSRSPNTILSKREKITRWTAITAGSAAALALAACGTSSPNTAPAIAKPDAPVTAEADPSTASQSPTQQAERGPFAQALAKMRALGDACLGLKRDQIYGRAPDPDLRGAVMAEFYVKDQQAVCITDRIGSDAGSQLGLVSAHTETGPQATISMSIGEGGKIVGVTADTAGENPVELVPGAPASAGETAAFDDVSRVIQLDIAQAAARPTGS